MKVTRTLQKLSSLVLTATAKLHIVKQRPQIEQRLFSNQLPGFYS